MGEFVKVARASEIAPGEARAVEAEGTRIALVNVEGTFHATDDTCTIKQPADPVRSASSSDVLCPPLHAGLCQ
ncbi:MAG TPA: Rieske 2Fe-2S domain-containing protein [Bryobacteraceae bacterium]|nr:Rieske 2Fe-2S domain-containing protein [Bryobacteraceae bacterium]